jgi:hypothetical protein
MRTCDEFIIFFYFSFCLYLLPPDIVAPGFSTESTKSGSGGAQTCDLMFEAGTSMATPAVAGNAALVRQYFKDTRFWAATCDPTYDLCGSFDARGATVKAVLLHSGEQMTRYSATTGTTEGTTAIGTTPDFYQGNAARALFSLVSSDRPCCCAHQTGFGRVLLSNALPLSGTTVTNFDLFVDEFTLSSFQRKTYTVIVSANTAPLVSADNRTARSLLWSLISIFYSLFYVLYLTCSAPLSFGWTWQAPSRPTRPSFTTST